MNEAMGELNGTVIVVIAIAGFATFFFSVLWPNINNDIGKGTNCAKAICEKCPGSNCLTVKCHEQGNESNVFECPYKG